MSIIEFTLVNNDSSRIFLKLSGNKKPSEVSFKGSRVVAEAGLPTLLCKDWPTWLGELNKNNALQCLLTTASNET